MLNRIPSAVAAFLTALPLPAQVLTVDAGPDRVVTSLRAQPPLHIELLGAVSDPSAQVLWEQISGRNQPVFAQPQSPRTTVTFLESGPYTLRLRATLGGQTAADTVQVRILVPPLPADNLLRNPWFRDASGTSGSMAGWTVGLGSWNATKKGHNPSPDTTGQTAADLDPRIANGQDTWIHQVVAADSRHTRLRFQMYWVTISMPRVWADVLAGPTANGPWTKVWTPFREDNAHTRRWDQSDPAATTLAQGHPFYRLELHGLLPAAGGATKYTGIYLATGLAGQGPATYTPFGNGCAGVHAAAPTLQAVGGAPRLGQRFDLRLTVPPGTSGPRLLFFGGSAERWGGVPLPLDLTPLGLPRCTLYAEPLLPVALTSDTLSAVIPGDASLVGAEVYVQALVGDLVSDAGRAILGTY